MSIEIQSEFDITLPVDKIIIEGGPCSGKTTGIEMIVKLLVERGIIPIVLPEVATFLIASGLHPKDFSDTEYQSPVYQIQAQIEDRALELAYKLQVKFKKRVVIICDRAKLSGSGYMKSNNQQIDFQKLVLEPLGLSLEKIRSEYKGVVYLKTAAEGAEEFYTLANNASRYESPEEARNQCNRSLQAHFGFEEIRVIKNRDGNDQPIPFNEKILLAAQAFFSLIGEPFPIQNERRFLLQSFDPALVEGLCEKISIKQVYLVSDEGTEEWVRERSWMGMLSYSHARKTPHVEGGRIKKLSTISLAEYNEAVENHAAPTHQTILKDRYCFSWNNNYYKIDVFQEPGVPPILEMYGDIVLPPFIHLDREVTGERGFYNFELSKIK